MMRDYYDTLVLGASLTGLGYAQTHPNTLVLEASEMPAPEFTAAFRPVKGAVRFYGTPLEKSLIRDGILSEDGALDVLTLSVGLYKFILEQKLEILFLAEVLSVTKSAEDFLVEFLTNTGIRTVRAPRLLDTRPGKGAKTFNVLCHNPSEGFGERLSEQFGEGVQVVSSGRKDEYTVCLPVPAHAELYDARQIVTESWSKAFPDGETKITVAAFDFDIRPDEGIKKADSRQAYIPAAYENPLEAFEAGIHFSFEKEEA